MITFHYLTPFAVLLASVSFVLAQTNTGTNTQPFNPDPKDCCNCITIGISRQTQQNSPGKQAPSIPAETNGDFKIPLKVTVTNSTGCSEVNITAIELVPEGGVGDASTVTVVVNNPSKVYDGIVTIPGSQAQSSETKKWKVVVSCSGTSTATSSASATSSCEYPFTLGSGCKPCQSGTCPGSAENGCFSYDIPVGASNGGDTTGTLRFFTPDFTNPGRSGVAAFVPSTYTVNRTAGIITSVVNPTNTIELSSAATAFDPNAFTITHKHTATGTVFRTTTIGRVQEGAVTYFRADSTYDLTTFRFQQSQPAAGTFLLESGPLVGSSFTALRKENLTITVPQLGTEIHRETTQELDPATSTYVTVSDTATTWNKFAWGWEMTQQAIEPSSANLVSNWTYYQPGETTGPNASTEGLGQIRTLTRYDGHQEVHTYWLNNHQTQLPFAGNAQGLTLSRQYNPATRTTTTTRTVAGNILSKETATYDPATNISTNTTYSSATESLSTITKLMPYTADFGGQPASILHPDTTLTTYSYQRHSDGGKTIIMKNGAASGNTVSLGKSTTTTYNRYGTIIRSLMETIGYSTNITLDHSAVTSVDDFGRPLITAAFPTASSAADGAVQATATAPKWTTAQSYSCCGTATATDRQGTVTTFAYDGLRRQTKSTSLGVTQETVHRGLTSDSHRYSAGGSATAGSLISRSSSNLARTQLSSWSPDPSTTTAGALVETTTNTTYQPAVGLSTRILTTTPTGTQTTDTFLDGKTSKTTGDLQSAMIYSYTVNATGPVSTRSYLDGTIAKETSSTQSDWAGRTLTTTQGAATTTYAFNSLGQAVSTTDADGVRSFSAYNSLGEHTTTALDVNGNGQIDYNGPDRITVSTTAPGTYSGFPVMSNASEVYATKNSTTATTVNTSYSTPDGLRSWSLAIGVATPSSSVTNPSNWEQTTTNPDGTYSVTTQINGRFDHATIYASNAAALRTTSTSYDTLGRPITSTDSRTGTTTTAYVSATADAIASVTDPGGRVTSYAYDSSGRRLSTTLPDTTVTYASYYPDGQVKATWGSQTYPTFTTYDYADRRRTLRTQPTLAAGIPTDLGGSLTTWNYSTITGQLISKLDAVGKGANYTYTAAGRLFTRTWARSSVANPMITTYSYTAGQLYFTDYSDTTPDVALTFDRLGRPETITQTNQSQITHTYDPATFAPDTETIKYDLDHNGTYEFTRLLDHKPTNLGRDAGFELKNGNTVENQATYIYDNAGRISTIAGASNTFTYGYQYNQSTAADPRIGSTTGNKQDFMPYTVAGPVHTVTNTYDARRDALLTKANTKNSNSSDVSSIGYIVNPIGQRTKATRSGAATNTTDWGYDSLGQVATSDDSTTAYDRAYQYDTIGNRQRIAAGTLDVNDPGATVYAANALNQYYSIGNQQSAIVSPSYDFDGNMTSGPLPTAPTTNSALVWDAENRLVSTTVGSTTKTTLYDSQSRRIAETQGAATTLYIYDGWNCITEYEGGTGVSPVLKKSRLWGLDLSGSMQGAGGVGGLLCESQISNSQISNYSPTYDGNGNVSEYLDSIGAIQAHYEYDPFGNTTISTGPKAADFAHRFSTKPVDAATGLYYYTYRYYDPNTGRWLSRDPIQEKGGLNLYGFVGNNAVNRWDVLGLRWEMGSWERTQAVRDKVKSQLDVLAQEIISEGKNAGVPLGCKTTSQNTQVLVEFKKKSDVAFASMYFTGFFALGGVSVNLVGSEEYSYDCCKRKPIAYHVDIDASFRDDFDELINIWEPGWGDTDITFVGSWVEEYDGSF